MSRSGPIPALFKALLVVLATAAGAAAGGLTGMAYAMIAMPNAGLESIAPFVICTFVGSVAGAFAQLAVLFKILRVNPDRARALAAVALLLLVLGAGSCVAAISPPDSALATAGTALLPLGVLAVVVTGSSLAYGRTDAARV